MEPKVDELVMRGERMEEGKGKPHWMALRIVGKRHMERWEKIMSGNTVEDFEKEEKITGCSMEYQLLSSPNFLGHMFHCL